MFSVINETFARGRLTGSMSDSSLSSWWDTVSIVHAQSLHEPGLWSMGKSESAYLKELRGKAMWQMNLLEKRQMVEHDLNWLKPGNRIKESCDVCVLFLLATSLYAEKRRQTFVGKFKWLKGTKHLLPWNSRLCCRCRSMRYRRIQQHLYVNDQKQQTHTCLSGDWKWPLKPVAT